ncbi:MAG: class I SAM-dependent methyltransferase [Solirubrobacteraceae bacterium MAG38_C4-C5]|nr:class I SAM-dependent methyltransferase [Candidatus Siliceabacter maunaloa]
MSDVAPAATLAIPPRCAWCAADLDADARRLAGRTVCGACGVATTTPWPSRRELDEAHAGAYRPQGGRFAGPGDALLRRTRGFLARRIDALAPPGAVLDIGCGDGALLRALAGRGRAGLGLELGADEGRSPRAARSAAIPPRVVEADVEDLDEGWAAIVAWHSLEHLPAPGLALDGAAARLAPRGLLVVAMPNAASVQARVFGDRWLALDPPRHLVHVPAAALCARVRAAGLRVERRSHLRGGQAAFGWLHGLVGALPGTADLYDAVRRPDARKVGQSPGRRAATLAAAGALTPLALAAAGLEAAAGRGGSIYLEARRD